MFLMSKMLYEATSGKLWKWPLSDRWHPKSHSNIIYVYTKSFTPISLCGRTQVVYFWVKQNTFMIAVFCQIWCMLFFLDYFYVRNGCLIYHKGFWHNYFQGDRCKKSFNNWQIDLFIHSSLRCVFTVSVYAAIKDNINGHA